MSDPVTSSGRTLAPVGPVVCRGFSSRPSSSARRSRCPAWTRYGRTWRTCTGLPSRSPPLSGALQDRKGARRVPHEKRGSGERRCPFRHPALSPKGRGREVGLDELGVDGLDPLLAPLDRLLQIHLV